MRAAFAAAPDARFVAHAGDLLDDGYDDGQWRAWLAGMGDEGLRGALPFQPRATTTSSDRR